MDTFEREVLRRVPLAEAVLTILRHVWDEQRLAALFEQHRGTGSTCKIRFSDLVNLISEALIHHQGSGRKAFQQARKEGRLEATAEAVYGKLRRCPVSLSEAFLTETTQYLQELLPDAKGTGILPESLAEHRVWIIDGKKLKKLPKRLSELRGVSGKVLGGTAVVGMLLNSGLAYAMHASPDGEANDAPLTPGLIDRINQFGEGPTLIVADRQFCDLKIPHYILAQGFNFIVRYTKKMLFSMENEHVYQDAEGRTIRDAIGILGSEKDARRLRLRMVTLERPDAEDVILCTDLIDDQEFPAEDILQVYLQRWSIERLFQQVTEVFHLTSFIGTSPQGAIFQFALCTCLYNVIQVLRDHLAVENNCPPQSLSSELIFYDVGKQFAALDVLGPGFDVATLATSTGSARTTRERLREILANQWSDRWKKSPKQKRKNVRAPTPVRGGHSSAFKLIQAARAAKAAQQHQ